MAATPDRCRSAPLLPLEEAPFHVAVRLAEDGAPEPWMRIAGAAERRGYEALLLSSTGAELARLLLELPSPPSAEQRLPGSTDPSNAALLSAWAKELSDLSKLASPSFPPLVLPSPADGALLPPTLFDPASERFHRIPCPRCFAPLRTCRSEAALAAAGLPPFGSSSRAERLLHCASCEGAPFYREQEDDSADSRIRGARALREALSAIDREAGSAAGLPVPLLEALRGTAKRGKPTATAVRIFNFHDEPFAVTRLAPVSFDEAAAALGGGDAAEGTPTLFAGGGDGLDAVELFLLKLGFFRQVTAALVDHHRRLGRPHLDLHPGNVAADRGDAGSALPSLWSLRARLLGSRSASVTAVPGAADRNVTIPPARPVIPYAAPELRDFHLVAERPADLVIERLSAEADGRRRLSGRLLDANGIYPRPGEADHLLLAFTDPAAAFGLPRLALRPDPRAAPRATRGEIDVTSEPFLLDEAAAARLGASPGLRIAGARYKVFPDYGAPQDLHALGLLLLRLLLVHDSQSLAEIDDLTRAARGEAPGESDAAAAAARLLREHPAEAGARNVFQREVDRRPDRPNAIPAEAWADALGLAFELSGPERFRGSGSDAFAPALRRTEALIAALGAVLFSRQTVHVEVQTVLAELLAEEGATRR